MTPENFIYWLQGFLEIQNPEQITKEQIQIIKDHVGLVLHKVTPNRVLNDVQAYDLKNNFITHPDIGKVFYHGQFASC